VAILFNLVMCMRACVFMRTCVRVDVYVIYILRIIVVSIVLFSHWTITCRINVVADMYFYDIIKILKVNQERTGHSVAVGTLDVVCFSSVLTTTRW